jgi:DNA-binding transcriptional LysR family regulator
VRVQRARYFLAAVETGSLRAAAHRCAVSQPTIGQQVALLEEELDVVLLTRSRHGVSPTAAGQALLEPLARLVAAEDAVLAAATESSGTYTGRVSIGAISVVAETLVAPVVARLRAHHPNLRFTLLEASSKSIEADVLTGDLDFGVITSPAEPVAPGLVRSPLISAPVGIVVPGDHLLAEREHVHWRDLETWPVVTMREGTVMWQRLHSSVSAPDVVIQAMSARSVKVMVAQGAGVGILAPFDTSLDVPGLRWIQLRDAEPVQICIVQRRDSQPSPSALVVRKLVNERAAELLEPRVGHLPPS